jgi:hypothetical protein
MAAAGYVIEMVFGPLGLIPAQRNAKVLEASISWNYTTWLNLIFLILAAVLVVRFIRTGGLPMLKMMGGGPDDMSGHPEDGGPGHGHDEQGAEPHRHNHQDHRGSGDRRRSQLDAASDVLDDP